MTKIRDAVFWVCVFVFVLAAWGRSEAQEAPMCAPIAELKPAFALVYRGSRQVAMEGAEAQAYLAAYNTHGQPTEFTADSLLFIQAPVPAAPVLIVLVRDGMGCERLQAGAKLHQMLMAKTAAGAI
jgi:hypothetical protein